MALQHKCIYFDKYVYTAGYKRAKIWIGFGIICKLENSTEKKYFYVCLLYNT